VIPSSDFWNIMATHLSERTSASGFFWCHDNTPSCTPALVMIFVQNLKL